jgi:hypothetical protein
MGQTFLLFAMPLVFTAAAKVAVPAVRPLGHGVLFHGVFCHVFSVPVFSAPVP